MSSPPSTHTPIVPFLSCWRSYPRSCISPFSDALFWLGMIWKEDQMTIIILLKSIWVCIGCFMEQLCCIGWMVWRRIMKESSTFSAIIIALDDIVFASNELDHRCIQLFFIQNSRRIINNCCMSCEFWRIGRTVRSVASATARHTGRWLYLSQARLWRNTSDLKIVPLLKIK